MFQIGGKMVGPFLVIWNFSNLLPTDLFRLVILNVTGELIPENLLRLSVVLRRRFWLVRFLHPRFNDRRALVPEQGLSFGYCVMQLVEQFQVACYFVVASNSRAFHEP